MQLNKSEDFVSNIPLVMYLPLNAFSCVTFAFCLLVLAADSAVALAVVKARVCDLRLLVFCRYVFLCIGTREPVICMGVALTWFWPGITMAHILGLFQMPALLAHVT